MGKKQDDDGKKVTTPEEEPVIEPQATDTTPQQTAVTQDSDEDKITPERYKGIQKVVAKKDVEIGKLQTSVTELSEQLEELKATTGNTEQAKSDAEKKMADIQDQLTGLQSERENLNQKLTQQGIVMKEFPSLAPLAEYIPVANDEDGFRDNAKQFSEALNAFVDQGVDAKLAGASLPSPKGEDEIPTENEVDKAYDKVVNLAGVLGKEAEYEDAFQKHADLLAARGESTQ
jgi:hypothetical protein